MRRKMNADHFWNNNNNRMTSNAVQDKTGEAITKIIQMGFEPLGNSGQFFKRKFEKIYELYEIEGGCKKPREDTDTKPEIILDEGSQTISADGFENKQNGNFETASHLRYNDVMFKKEKNKANRLFSDIGYIMLYNGNTYALHYIGKNGERKTIQGIFQGEGAKLFTSSKLIKNTPRENDLPKYPGLKEIISIPNTDSYTLIYQGETKTIKNISELTVQNGGLYIRGTQRIQNIRTADKDQEKKIKNNIEIDHKDGFIQEHGSLYYIENGEKMYIEEIDVEEGELFRDVGGGYGIIKYLSEENIIYKNKPRQIKRYNLISNKFTSLGYLLVHDFDNYVIYYNGENIAEGDGYSENYTLQPFSEKVLWRSENEKKTCMAEYKKISEYMLLIDKEGKGNLLHKGEIQKQNLDIDNLRYRANGTFNDKEQQIRC